MNTKYLGILLIGIVVITAYLGAKLSKIETTQAKTSEKAYVEANNMQYIDMTAKAGYYPKVINALANKKTLLKVHTSNTLDCSSALVIPSINYRKNLPVSGTTEIEIPPQKAGTIIKGSCSMGMYTFNIYYE